MKRGFKLFNNPPATPPQPTENDGDGDEKDNE